MQVETVFLDERLIEQLIGEFRYARGEGIDRTGRKPTL